MVSLWQKGCDVLETKFSGITVQLSYARAKLVFPAKLDHGFVEFRKNMSPNQHIHYDIEVHFVLSGSYLLVTDRQEFLLEENTVCVIPKGCSHQLFAQESCSDIFNVLVTLSAKGKGVRSKTVTQLWNGLKEVQIFPDNHRICDHVRDFCTACKGSGDVNLHIRESLMTLVFCLVTEKLSERFPNQSKVAKACKLPYDGAWFDADLENFLMCNYKSKLSREAVAKHIGISSAQLSRIIQRNYGTNYIQLMTSLRMADAKKLLQTDLSITEIAKSLGYGTYNGFATAFKKHFGITPEAMRKDVKQ